MTDLQSPVTFLCNGASRPKNVHKADGKILDYRGRNPNVNLKLPDFVRDVLHLPDRVLDLLEIAAYVFAADRSTSRGEYGALEFHGWSRSFRFCVKVRDIAFWRRAGIRDKLAATLQWMSGDQQYEFIFQPGHATPATNLFDKEGFTLLPDRPTDVILFSGGLDSLAGTVGLLKESTTTLCLVSHQSGQTGTMRTQNQLVAALDERFPKRIEHYKFKCGLRGERAAEETQRTRSFLYSVTGFALACAARANRFVIFENGITSINFPRRADLFNARATRTTHPKTIRLVQEFLSEVAEAAFLVETPYFWKTKTEVVKLLGAYGLDELISSSVSCSRTFQKVGQSTQCGGCSQCIDRRFAAYAAGLDDADHAGLYTLDFLTEKIGDLEARKTLLDYVRQAIHFSEWTLDDFQQRLLPELADIEGTIDMEEDALISGLHDLCKRHGAQVALGISRMRLRHDDPYRPVVEGSFFSILGRREYLAEPTFDYAAICSQLQGMAPGNESATQYENAVQAALHAIFHPHLVSPKSQQRVDAGRMKIDITFDNRATSGFFLDLRDSHKRRCAYVLFECKNYSEDVGNPEFAQLNDRLDRLKMDVGFIVCRSVEDDLGVLKHCQDRTAT